MDTLSPELPEILRLLISLGIVLALIAGLAFMMKKLGMVAESATFGNKGKERRLSLVETLPLDARRRVALIRRDDQEHLVILSATGETLIEANIPVKDTPDQTSVDGTKKQHNKA